VVARRIAAARFPVERVRLDAERLPFDDARFDTVVSTWTLCSIPDPVAALREMRRVLRPEGRYVFLEHGRSDDARVARFQDRFNPVQRRLGCGCNINRRIDTLLQQAGFVVGALDRYVLPGPRTLGTMYRGSATAGALRA
jgi:ubiquinone/menaquinone biosynthesis C-methylase UbiE